MDDPEGPDVEYDSETGVYRAEFDWEGDRRLSATLAAVVATIEDRDPAGIAPLHERVDPGALDDLFAPRSDGTARARGAVTFPLADYDVTVRADGEILVRPPEG